MLCNSRYESLIVLETHYIISMWIIWCLRFRLIKLSSILWIMNINKPHLIYTHKPGVSKSCSEGINKLMFFTKGFCAVIWWCAKPLVSPAARDTNYATIEPWNVLTKWVKLLVFVWGFLHFTFIYYHISSYKFKTTIERIDYTIKNE